VTTLTHLLRVEDLRVSYHTYAGEVQSVRGVSFDLNAGETLAIVGESGCGKSVTARSIMNLIRKPGEIKPGSKITFQGRDVLQFDKKELRQYRGGDVAMIFQDALVSLNPTMSVGKQIAETLRIHNQASKKSALQEAIRLLDLVGIPEPDKRVNQYAHQFSGGMRQRVMIAMALACNPKILIADEPTTSLDVTIQAQIMELIAKLKKELNMAVVLITHDLGVVAGVADRILVMYSGKIVERSVAREIFYQPKHPYTLSLINAIPKITDDTREPLVSIQGTPPDLLAPPAGCPFASRCKLCMKICKTDWPSETTFSETHSTHCWYYHEMAPKVSMRDYIVSPNEDSTTHFACEGKGDVILDIKDLKKYYPLGRKIQLAAVDGVSLQVRKGETLSLVGESGCGKTTLGRTAIGIYSKTDGKVLYKGEDVHAMNANARHKFTKEVQVILQDPYTSLDPRMTVSDLIGEGLDIHHLYKNRIERADKIFRLLEQVGLNREHANRFPHEFSGGQRQRIGIARAIALDPEFLLCDEPISALDVSIQAQIINLLMRLQQERNLTYLFIAHDLSMVRYISDRVAVMYLGRLVELASSDELYKNTLHPYTRALISAIPIADPDADAKKTRILLMGETTSPINMPKGCRFASRCRYVQANCRENEIPLVEVSPDHFVACVSPGVGS